MAFVATAGDFSVGIAATTLAVMSTISAAGFSLYSQDASFPLASSVRAIIVVSNTNVHIFDGSSMSPEFCLTLWTYRVFPIILLLLCQHLVFSIIYIYIPCVFCIVS